MTALSWIKKSIKKCLGIPIVSHEPITVYPKTTPRGRVLVSYLEQPLLWPENDERFAGHSNNWESREIVRIFNQLGYIVDCINWTNTLFYPQHEYDILFDIHTNLQRLAPFMSKNTKTILHVTGSYVFYQRAAEMERVAALEERTGKLYSPKRIAAHLDLAERSLRLANYCTLLGNDHTLSTYPTNHQQKTTLVTVSASALGFKKDIKNYVPPSREFIWFYGGGAVNKGLDLVLEVFRRNPHLTLNVVGKLESEKDFLAIYHKEIFQTPNINYHGYLYPSSKQFIAIAQRCFAYIAPSCSEAISAAAVTCMQLGFYPIISKDNGITLPNKCGIYLEKCTIDEIEQAVQLAYTLPTETLISQIKPCQEFALDAFSRKNFHEKMRAFFTSITK